MAIRFGGFGFKLGRKRVSAVSVDVAPANTKTPGITGITRVGQELHVDAGTWTGTPAPLLSYQWYRGTTAIAGATGQNYVLTEADIGASLECAVTGSNRAGTLTVRSGRTSSIQAAQSLPAVTSLVAFGDSITAGSSASVAGKRWVNLVGSALNAALANAGIAGTVLQNSADASGAPRANNGRDRYVRALTGTAQKDLAIIAYGFNDARYIGSPSTFNLNEYLSDYREVVSGLLTAGYAPDRIVIASPYFITDAGLGTGSSGFAGQTRLGFEAFVSAASSIATEFGTFYADLYKAMRDNGGASLISSDNIHPNDEGHQVIANAILMATKRSAPGDTTAPTITSANAFTTNEGAIYDHQLTANEAVTWSKVGGADAALFSLSGSILSLSARDYEVPSDADGNNTYVVTVRATDAAGNRTDQIITGTVRDVIEAPPTTSFLSDSFTDTDGTLITAHAPEIGGVYRLQSGYAPDSPSRIANGRLWSPSAGAVYANEAEPASADYEVSAIVEALTDSNGADAGLCARMQADANTLYFARYRQGTGFQLYKTVAGTSTLLKPAVAGMIASGASKKLTLRIVGSSLTVLLDDVAIISATDTSIVGKGKAGVRFAAFATATTGVHLASLEAKNVG